MKKIILPFLFLFTASVHAQPKLTGTLTNAGQKDGGGVFRIDMPGTTPGMIHSFDNTGPHAPAGGVCAGDGNWLYGIVSSGGIHQLGALYRVQQNGTGFTNLYDFVSNSGTRVIPYYHTDGKIYFTDQDVIKTYDPLTSTIVSLPGFGIPSLRSLLIDADDWMYFMEGTVSPRLVKMKTDGSAWTDLHDFIDATEGYYGKAGVTEIPGDSLVGVQTSGGVSDGGTLYSIRKDGTGFTILRQFSQATGINPESKLVYFDGKIFGTTSLGGSFDKGVLFSINPDGTGYRVLHHFEASINNAFASNPFGNIVVSSNGRIFGSFAEFWQTSTDYSRLFKVDSSGDNFEGFTVGNSFNVDRDNGRYNQDILLLNDESIFFTTSQTGRNDGGVLNYCDTTGAGNALYHFGYSANGFRPTAGLIKASNGKLYGTASIGGTSGNGVVFSMNADGTGYTKLHEFTDAEGYELSGKLLEASDGKLYGTCKWGGGPSSFGCIYRLDKNGSNFTVIYFFENASTGYAPVGSLIEDNSGVLYGSTFYNSSSGLGAVFKINKDGTNYTLLRDFGSGDLNYPYNGLTLSGNYLYGACGYGGTGNKGGIFRLKKDGSAYQVLHEFTGTGDGELPVGTPLLASNGKLYGSTDFGGSDGEGTVYSMDSTGSNFSLLRDLTAFTDGGYPWSAFIQGSDGLIYGTTQTSGAGGGGTIFKMNLNGSGFSVVKTFDLSTEGGNVVGLLDLNGGVILPVHLLLFTAEKKNQAVLLSWKTAQEQNSDRFEIERSSGGTVFSTIGTVAAAGNTNALTSYSFTDSHPLDRINYYRLKQIDSDAKFTYSKTILVNFNNSDKLIVSPNPASDQLNIQLPTGRYFTAISIFDASGKLVLQKNIVPLSTNCAVDIHSLFRGWYTLKLTGKENEQRSFIKE
jgi:uncharacterized repeat protein (TIGR03803 family)